MDSLPTLLLRAHLRTPLHGVPGSRKKGIARNHILRQNKEETGGKSNAQKRYPIIRIGDSPVYRSNSQNFAGRTSVATGYPFVVLDIGKVLLRDRHLHDSHPCSPQGERRLCLLPVGH